MRCLVAIVGPTAVGKSDLAIQIARKYGGEIINGDSRQIYKYMDIGTAKPNPAQQRLIPHHLLDIILPDQSYSVSLYQQSAFKVIDDIQNRAGLPLLVGGSGQYIWSVIEGWSIPRVAPDQDFRLRLESRAGQQGAKELYQELKDIDPLAASRILPNNLRRIIRALEIYHSTGVKPSELQVKTGLPYPVLILGLTCPREQLYSFIDRRTDGMIKAGFVDEVKGLLSMGYSPGLPSMSSLGYRQLAAYLRQESNLETAVQNIKFETHRFARAQYAWFRLKDKRIKWLQAGDDINDEINYTIKTFLESAG